MKISPIKASIRYICKPLEKTFLGDLYKLTKLALQPVSSDYFVKRQNLFPVKRDSIARIRRRVNAHDFRAW